LSSIKNKRDIANDHAKIGSVANATDANDEHELKLEIDPSRIEELLAHALFKDHNIKERTQVSVYHDTPRHLLRKAGFSLRVRTVGENRVQTIKAESAAAAGLFVRPEWEREIQDDSPVLDQGDVPFHGLLSDAKIGKIKPIFCVNVTRQIMMVERGATSIEVVLDQGEVRAQGRASPIHELELELKSGQPAALFDLARALDQAAPMRLGVLTKSERGYLLGEAVTDKPVKTAPLNLQSGITAASAFQVVIGACLRQFRLNEAILLHGDSAGALHQARVALRRLRSALSTFKPIVQDGRYEHFREELRWIAGELGHARNLDVLIERMSDATADCPLRAAREQAYAVVQTALASTRMRLLMLNLAEWSAIGSWLSHPERTEMRAQPVDAFATKALDKHRRRLKRLGNKLITASDEERHEARIEAKKLRYATEFFAGLFSARKASRRYRRFYKALATLQSHLGDLNDLATAPMVLAQLDLLGTGTAAALQPDVSRRDPLIKQAAAAYDALMDRRRFWR
jgi:triphosphatase